MELSDVRRHPRYEVSIKVEVTVRDSGRTLVGTVRNVSMGGVFIELTERLPPQSTIALELVLPGHSDRFRCEASVCWSRAEQKQPGVTGVGVRFSAVSLANLQYLAMFLAGQEHQALFVDSSQR